MSQPITTRDLYNALREKLGLEWLAGRNGSERALQGDFPDASGQSLVGPLNCIHPNRVQLIGHAELSYFASLDQDFYRDIVDMLFTARPAAVILAEGVEVGQLFHNMAEQTRTPLLRSGLPDNRLLNDLQYYLTHVLAERTTIHGVFIEVLSVGVLLTGGSAVGKSELALELISRGHRLVADDAPEFARIAPDIIRGTCPPLLRDFLEVRGLGLLDIRAMFGDSAIKQQKYLHLIIELSEMDEQKMATIDRLEGNHDSINVLGLDIPRVTLPIAAGRQMAILVEAAVQQHTLRRNGYNAAEVFMRRQQRAINKG